MGLDQNGIGDACQLAWADVYAAQEDVLLDVPVPGVLANDRAAGAGLTVALVASPAHGTLTLSPDGKFQYTPAPNFNGTDQFTYSVSSGPEGRADVRIAVAPANDPPSITPVPPQTVTVGGTQTG